MSVRRYRVNQNKKTLDFIIIGAQKGGTTSLFKYLIEHPAIYMPPEKEAPFFSHADYHKGWDWFLQEYFAHIPPGRLWGKASTQYMGHGQVPQRLAQQLPEVKLIALLREPVNRAASHYKMNVRHGIETRSFEQVIQDLLCPEALAAARANPAEETGYVVWGEYGRLLTDYLKYFRREQLLVLFTRDLELFPQALMRQIYAFLNIETIFPQNLGRHFHAGGTRKRLSWLRPLARSLWPIKASWDLLPIRIQLMILYWYEQWNIRPDRTQPLLLPETLAAFQEHYSADAALLEKSCQLVPHWLAHPEYNK
jgi:hypothetical protein